MEVRSEDYDEELFKKVQTITSDDELYPYSISQRVQKRIIETLPSIFLAEIEEILVAKKIVEEQSFILFFTICKKRNQFPEIILSNEVCRVAKKEMGGNCVFVRLNKKQKEYQLLMDKVPECRMYSCNQ